jgi:phospholipase C
MAGSNQLGAIDHIVVLMLENRSFDHMLGYLYADRANQSLAGQPFDGLTGHESNPDAAATAVPVFQITSATPNAYLMPGADPGEGYPATNAQLFGTITAPSPAIARNDGFVTNFATTLAREVKVPSWGVVPGTTDTDIMGMFTPATLPILSGLARGYAVCDEWFSSAPTETMPNRAFVSAGTSQGHMDDKTKSFTCGSIFGALSQHGVSWRIFGDNADPLTRLNFPDTSSAPNANFGRFPDFQAAAAAGSLPAYTFLEPDWGSTGNSQHPNYDVAKGEQFILAVYRAVRDGPAWNGTLLIVTYDEHGGCYDHVAPPTTAVAPDSSAGEYGFDFTRFGLRVPTVLISPWVAPGTVFRVNPGSGTLDHTSILATLERRFGLLALTARDRAAPDIGDALSESVPRTDDPLRGVLAPAASPINPSAPYPSHLQTIHAELVAHLPVPGEESPARTALAQLHTSADYASFIDQRTAAWKATNRG